MDAKVFKNYCSWIIWLILLIIWNYALPEATPLEDVLIGIALAMLLRVLQRHFVR
tara:strand:- start:203 stop:367 length:165 start_codon:yes stop_codon:yes gene_type:complete